MNNKTGTATIPKIVHLTNFPPRGKARAYKGLTRSLKRERKRGGGGGGGRREREREREGGRGRGEREGGEREREGEGEGEGWRLIYCINKISNKRNIL